MKKLEEILDVVIEDSDEWCRNVNEFSNAIYLIEQARIDNLENTAQNAFGYTPKGFVFNEEIAKRICSEGRTLTGEDSWVLHAASKTAPEFCYKAFRAASQNNVCITEFKKGYDDAKTRKNCQASSQEYLRGYNQRKEVERLYNMPLNKSYSFIQE